MGHREISKRSDALEAFAKREFDMGESTAAQFVEFVTELAQAIADNEIDRLFNRGDYRS